MTKVMEADGLYTSSGEIFFQPRVNLHSRHFDDIFIWVAFPDFIFEVFGDLDFSGAFICFVGIPLYTDAIHRKAGALYGQHIPLDILILDTAHLGHPER